jgi:hypothetical protein
MHVLVYESSEAGISLVVAAYTTTVMGTSDIRSGFFIFDVEGMSWCKIIIIIMSNVALRTRVEFERPFLSFWRALCLCLALAQRFSDKGCAPRFLCALVASLQAATYAEGVFWSHKACRTFLQPCQNHVGLSAS